MAAYEESDFESAAEIPCEFCGLLWPIEIYVEHETGCRPDLTSSAMFADYEEAYSEDVDFEYDTAVPEKSASQIIDDVLASEVQKLSATLNRSINPKQNGQNEIVEGPIAKEPVHEVRQYAPAPIPPITVKSSYEPEKENMEIQMNNSSNESKQNKHNFSPPSTKEKKEVKGETLLSFGNVSDACKFSENETQDESQDEADDVEDIDNLSDIDCDETLEEFWKRARDFLNREKMCST